MRKLKASIRPFRRPPIASIGRDKRANSARLVPTTATMMAMVSGFAKPVLSRRAPCLPHRCAPSCSLPAHRLEIAFTLLKSTPSPAAHLSPTAPLIPLQLPIAKLQDSLPFSLACEAPNKESSWAGRDHARRRGAIGAGGHVEAWTAAGAAKFGGTTGRQD